MVEFTNVISPATILCFVGMLVAFGGWLLRIGAKNAAIDQVVADMKLLRNDFDIKIAATTARFEIVTAQASEFRETVAKNYATAASVRDVETRLSQNVDRVVDRLEHISARLDDITAKLVEAISRMK